MILWDSLTGDQRMRGETSGVSGFTGACSLAVAPIFYLRPQVLYHGCSLKTESLSRYRLLLFLFASSDTGSGKVYLFLLVFWLVHHHLLVNLTLFSPLCTVPTFKGPSVQCFLSSPCNKIIVVSGIKRVN